MRGLLTADYDFDLPDTLIAQVPEPARDGSRLLIVERNSGRISHGHFKDVVSLIPAGDTLALNTTRVRRARLLGTRDSGAPAEVFLLKELGNGQWEAMVQPGGKLKPGRRVRIGEGFSVRIDGVTERRTRLVTLECNGLSPLAAIAKFGHLPLPPYIDRRDTPQDDERYQTVYAQVEGSVAAPTAGLHFTTEVLDQLAAKGVGRAEVVLHVGAGTFKPVEVDDPADHVMHEEYFELSDGCATRLNATRSSGHQIWSVGTTVTRTLESALGASSRFDAVRGETRLFVRPPQTLRAIDRLITNFHLPRSTLIMLVAAFAGYDLTMEAYRVAIRAGYRFYSYGDAMVIL